MKQLIAYLSGFAFGFVAMYVIDELEATTNDRPRLVLVS
jgi:hypothetical protein